MLRTKGELHALADNEMKSASEVGGFVAAKENLHNGFAMNGVQSHL